MKRTPLQRRGPLKRTPFRPKPKQRVKKVSDGAADTVFCRSMGRCEARCAKNCTGRGEVLHHVQRRSQGGGHDADNLLHACRPCHDWIHANTGESYERGLLVRVGQVSRGSARMSPN